MLGLFMEACVVGVEPQKDRGGNKIREVTGTAAEGR